MGDMGLSIILPRWVCDLVFPATELSCRVRQLLRPRGPPCRGTLGQQFLSQFDYTLDSNAMYDTVERMADVPIKTDAAGRTIFLKEVAVPVAIVASAAISGIAAGCAARCRDRSS